MIEYIKLFWAGAPEGEPSVILYEVNTVNDRLALRSIDISALALGEQRIERQQIGRASCRERV